MPEPPLCPLETCQHSLHLHEVVYVSLRDEIVMVCKVCLASNKTYLCSGSHKHA